MNKYGNIDPAEAAPWPQRNHLHRLSFLPNSPLLLPLLPRGWQDPPLGVQALLFFGDLVRPRPHNRQTAISRRWWQGWARETAVWARHQRFLGPAQPCRTNPRWRLLVGQDFWTGGIDSSAAHLFIHFQKCKTDVICTSCQMCSLTKFYQTGSISLKSTAVFLSIVLRSIRKT